MGAVMRGRLRAWCGFFFQIRDPQFVVSPAISDYKMLSVSLHSVNDAGRARKVGMEKTCVCRGSDSAVLSLASCYFVAGKQSRFAPISD